MGIYAQTAFFSEKSIPLRKNVENYIRTVEDRINDLNEQLEAITGVKLARFPQIPEAAPFGIDEKQSDVLSPADAA
ncbi:hypothetical protein HK100_006357, partial [Physocladia obscura]